MDYTGSIYRLIDRAEDEMKEYAQRVKQLSADEIIAIQLKLRQRKACFLLLSMTVMNSTMMTWI